MEQVAAEKMLVFLLCFLKSHKTDNKADVFLHGRIKRKIIYCFYEEIHTKANSMNEKWYFKTRKKKYTLE